MASTTKCGTGGVASTHGQLIEINTKNLPDGTDPNRYAGIAQRVWLHPGATYEISFDALMREEPVAADEDATGHGRVGLLDERADRSVQDELSPDGSLKTSTPDRARCDASFSERFTAQGGHATLAIWGFKKWATLNRELDVNLDNVSLRMCRKGMEHPPVQPP